MLKGGFCRHRNLLVDWIVGRCEGQQRFKCGSVQQRLSGAALHHRSASKQARAASASAQRFLVGSFQLLHRMDRSGFERFDVKQGYLRKVSLVHSVCVVCWAHTDCFGLRSCLCARLVCVDVCGSMALVSSAAGSNAISCWTHSVRCVTSKTSIRTLHRRRPMS